jgi:two-component system sensor histidine kinase RegB
MVVCGTAIVLVTLLANFHLPLITQSGEVLRIPQIFVYGHWTALIIAVVFTSAYSRRVTTEVHSMSDALAATQMALAREQKLTDLGRVVAAAAHEFGTPLATIKLASTELMNDLKDHPEMAEDAALIRDQADRCRDILRDMGRAGKDDLHMRQAPLEAVIEEAAEPHMERGKSVHILHAESVLDQDQPEILRKPEIIHGLRNLVQNAVDFARAQVWAELSWTDNTITVRIMDDGPGFPPHLLGRMGDPFMRSSGKQASGVSRPAYEGMGLGLFIAKTLLERTDAKLRFANGPEDEDQTGAVVEVTWPRAGLETLRADLDSPLGENEQIAV